MQEIERFRVRTESGEVYEAAAWAETKVVQTFGKQPEIASSGVYDYRLTDGRDLEPSDDGGFVIVGTQERVYRIDNIN